MYKRWLAAALTVLGASIPNAWAEDDSPFFNPELPRDLHGIWFDQGDDGWAAAMFDHRTAMSSVIMTYDVTGRNVWYTAPFLDCHRQMSPWINDRCDGPLYKVTGTPVGSSWRPADVTVRQVGDWSGSFLYPLFGGTGPDQERTLYLSYTVDSADKRGSGQKPMRAQVIDGKDPLRWLDGRYSGLWSTLGENGWGVGINVQNKELYATLFVHGPDKQPRWYVIIAKDANPFVVVPDLTFVGDVYETTGFAVGELARQGSKSVRRVGSATIHFDAEPVVNATLRYSIDGVEVSKNITRPQT